ncbi:MAG TPA: hypothetical protein VD978_16590 [Azospirillum sp.]|nr:hypothetical protein [Azospirillum sp.]
MKYALSFDGSAFTVQTKIHLTGDDPGATRQVWESGIEGIWSNKYSLSDGSGRYPIRVDVQFVNSGQDYDVAVHNTDGRGDMQNWYLATAWGPSYQDELAAHEYGHMLGAFDEYAGGATYLGRTSTGTIMSDLGPTVTSSYFSSVDSYAEQFTGRTFTVVAGAAPAATAPTGINKTGNGGNNTLSGGDGNDTLSGVSGNDMLRGRAGNDLLYGGSGSDWLYGGIGADTLNGDRGNDWLWGDRGNDMLTGGDGADRFCFASGSGVDRILDFNYAAGDRIQLASGLMRTLSSDSRGFAVVDLGNGDHFTLENIQRQQVTNAWFVVG